MTADEIATDFYIEFQTVCQREGDDTLPADVAKWVTKLILQEREACARVAETVPHDWLPNEDGTEGALRHKKKIAAAIRARKGDST